MLRDPYFITRTTNLGAFRPLSSFTFALNFFLFGDSPVSFHITSILLNSVAAFLVFAITDLLFKNGKLALFTFIFFSFLPIHTEAVAYIKARDEILSGIFILLSWFMFITASPKPRSLRAGMKAK